MPVLNISSIRAEHTIRLHDSFHSHIHIAVIDLRLFLLTTKSAGNKHANETHLRGRGAHLDCSALSGRLGGKLKPNWHEPYPHGT